MSTDIDERHYISHVSELGDSRDVVAAQDIHGANGVKLVAKGTRLNRKQLPKLLSHKLLQPIDRNLLIKDAVVPANLVKDGVELMER